MKKTITLISLSVAAVGVAAWIIWCKIIHDVRYGMQEWIYREDA